MSFTAELIYATLGTVAIWLAVLWVLLWRGSSSYSEADAQPVPLLYKPHFLGFLRRMKWINTVTGFKRRHTAQILVRSDFVVPTEDLVKLDDRINWIPVERHAVVSGGEAV